MKRTWLDDHVDLFLEELSVFDINVPREHAAELLRERVRAVADGMRIGETAARRYIDDEMIKDLAATLAFSIADEHPGADLFDLPRAAAVPFSSMGRLFASFAEAGQVRLVNADLDGAKSAFQLISAYGQLLHAWSSTASGQVPFPAAALTRGARFLEVTAEMLRGGAQLVEGIDPAAANAVAGQMAMDAATLRSLVAGEA